PGQCQVQPNARVNCGYPYISAKECYNKGCCFDSSIAGVIWCFFPKDNTAPLMPHNTLFDPNLYFPRVVCYEESEKDLVMSSYFNSRLQRTARRGNSSTFGLTGWSERPCWLNSMKAQHMQMTLKKIICHTLVTWDNHEFCLLTAKCRCDVDPHKRSNCGPPGITPQECENKGCCFSSTVPGVPWCFKPTPPKSKCRCDVDPHKRSNCGPPGITPQECENKGCCFNSTVPGVPWCFKPTPPK
ncbi:putative gastrointestinal growth factor xP4, partial [Protobothrops mucrosquamatus]|uniref:putative gastrointestinal growth factor xP4 n=1 Tax=Protobothrops mucrosquamatus TaxID=103944 RepID=UPI0007756459